MDQPEDHLRFLPDIGYYIPKAFEPGYFEKIQKIHGFCSLTESDKPGKALRTGLYMSDTYKEWDSGDIYFKLMRCSSNFSGPTEGLLEPDFQIISRAQRLANPLYPQTGYLNHVLAQIYHHGPEGKKGSIKKHSDKTEDMHPEGLLAFCTFYDSEGLKSSEGKENRFASLRFENKETKEVVQVQLEPDSLLLMDLAANARWTHEIRNSPLSHVPVRMGYVIRSSNRDARFSEGRTQIKDPSGKWVNLEDPSPDDLDLMRKLYYQENTSTQRPEYPFLGFSMNQGDYLKPVVFKNKNKE